MLVYFQIALGMAEYRSGHYPEAEQALLGTKTIAGDFSDTVAFYRAMILFQQGNPAEALALFAATEAKMKPFPADPQNPLAAQADHDYLILWLACKEARALLDSQATTPQ